MCINQIYIGRHSLTIVPHHITGILFYVHPENQASLQGYTHSPSIQCIGSECLLYLYAHSEYSSQVECIKIAAISLVEELVWVHVYWWSMFRSLSMKLAESIWKNMCFILGVSLGEYLRMYWSHIVIIVPAYVASSITKSRLCIMSYRHVPYSLVWSILCSIEYLSRP